MFLGESCRIGVGFIFAPPVFGLDSVSGFSRLAYFTTRLKAEPRQLLFKRSDFVCHIDFPFS